MNGTTVYRVRPLTPDDDSVLAHLAMQARNEGFKFLDRLCVELEHGSVERDGPRCFFLIIENDTQVVGVGGVTEDPYLPKHDTGRLRHLYVAPGARRRGVGRLLVSVLEDRALRQFATLRLRTDTKNASRFYEALGYEAIVSDTATHQKQCAST